MPPVNKYLNALKKKLSRLRGRRAIRQVKRSLLGFILGLFFASVYGLTALFIQSHDLWFCLITTGFIATFAGFGVGLSERVRTNVVLMLPMLCSKSGKNFVLFLMCTLVIQGPVSNTMKNIERAADSVICGAELVKNQTQQLLQRAANPLQPALNKIQQMSRNAYSVAGRAQNLIKTLTQSVQQIAGTLKNVLYFLETIGQVCNEKLGEPYQKCMGLFSDAERSCQEQLSVASFLCDIVKGFQTLCGISRVAELFCNLPSYIATQIEFDFAFPTITAFDKIKEEFEFNISSSINFDMLFNTSRSMEEAVQELMDEVAEELVLLRELKVFLAYMGFLLLVFMYIKAILYKNQYLHNDTFENIYITEQFINLDRKLSRQGKPAALPLSRIESLTYISPYSLYLTGKERKAVAGQVLLLLRYMAMTGILIAVDLLVFWVFELVYHKAQGEIFTQAPLVVAVQIDGSGFASDIFKDIAAAFDILQKGNITVISKKCLMIPVEPDYVRYLVIGFLSGLTLFLSVAGGYVKRIQRFVCAWYHPKREKDRIRYLHRHILSQRRFLGKALMRAVDRNKVDQQIKGMLDFLAKRVPILVKILGIGKESCMACGKVLRDDEKQICTTPDCTGSYCPPCFHLMENICPLCNGHQTYQNSDEERDSSDEEQLGLLSRTDILEQNPSLNGSGRHNTSLLFYFRLRRC